MQVETTIAEPIGSEAAAFASVVKWSADCPAWQRDALRRLCISGPLSATDTTELLAICKGETPGVPLEAAHVRDPIAGGAVVTLKQLYGLQHVNALAVGERLTFCKVGLTVVYGDNGAGKSGYARVLKQLCRARSGKGETILSNIYAANPGLPTATIDYLVGGQKHTAAWKLGEQSDAILSAVSVFDSQTANTHVDAANDLAYTPQPLKILAALADSCKQIQSKLTSEADALRAQTPEVLNAPACSPDTPVGRLIAGLSAKTNPATVAALAILTDEELQRLDALNRDLGADPSTTARQLVALKSRLDAMVNRLLAIEAAISDEEANELARLATALRTAQAAAAAASADLFAKEPLPEIGSDVWKSLWEAARAYSTEGAYPDHAFPFTEAGAHCVLCQQELTPQAAQRLTSFEAFVKDESARRERAAQAGYDQAVTRFMNARPKVAGLPVMVGIIRDDLGDASLAAQLRRELVVAAWRARSIFRTHRALAGLALTTLPRFPIVSLNAASAGLDQRVAMLTAENDSPARAMMLAERDALADRKWLDVVKSDVLAQIERLKAIASLAALEKDTKTKRITDHSTEIARALITDRLRARFAKEVDKLGVAGLAIELQQTKSSAGVPHFRVRLIDKPTEAVGKILSEGEHRCVALAAFLAELATIDAQSAIVFDDPVSSLDHRHRDKVAARLAEEGQHRQVIVLTHDMAFLLLLEEACRAQRDREAVPIAYRLISKGFDAPGYCNDDPPADVMPLDQVIGQMRRHLDNVKALHARGDHAGWVRQVKGLQADLRTAWERAVEEAVCPVIRRLARKVDTAGLSKLTVLKQQDCDAMRDAFGRCSMLLHSQPGELTQQPADPASVSSEIEALADWINDIRLRQSAVS